MQKTELQFLLFKGTGCALYKPSIMFTVLLVPSLKEKINSRKSCWNMKTSYSYVSDFAYFYVDNFIT